MVKSLLKNIFEHISCISLSAIAIYSAIYFIIPAIQTHGDEISNYILQRKLVLEIIITVILVVFFQFAGHLITACYKTRVKIGVVFHSDNKNRKEIKRGDEYLRGIGNSSARICLLGASGWKTFGHSAPLGDAIKKCTEARIILVNPTNQGIINLRARNLKIEPDDFRKKIYETICLLTKLKRSGKQIDLKFYDYYPNWKYIILGDSYIWVQPYPLEEKVTYSPCYILEAETSRGQAREENKLFYAFYDHFNGLWDNCHLAEYDFDNKEIVSTDGRTCIAKALDTC